MSNGTSVNQAPFSPWKYATTCRQCCRPHTKQMYCWNLDFFGNTTIHFAPPNGSYDGLRSTIATNVAKIIHASILNRAPRDWFCKFATVLTAFPSTFTSEDCVRNFADVKQNKRQPSAFFSMKIRDNTLPPVLGTTCEKNVLNFWIFFGSTTIHFAPPNGSYGGLRSTITTNVAKIIHAGILNRAPRDWFCKFATVLTAFPSTFTSEDCVRNFADVK